MAAYVQAKFEDAYPELYQQYNSHAVPVDALGRPQVQRPPKTCRNQVWALSRMVEALDITDHDTADTAFRRCHTLMWAIFELLQFAKDIEIPDELYLDFLLPVIYAKAVMEELGQQLRSTQQHPLLLTSDEFTSKTVETAKMAKSALRYPAYELHYRLPNWMLSIQERQSQYDPFPFEITTGRMFEILGHKVQSWHPDATYQAILARSHSHAMRTREARKDELISEGVVSEWATDQMFDGSFHALAEATTHAFAQTYPHEAVIDARNNQAVEARNQAVEGNDF